MADQDWKGGGPPRERRWNADVGPEIALQLQIALPLIVTNLVTYAIIVLAIMFVGHLGELELSSASFANSLASITGFTVMIGLGSALETLCGQAFGAKRYHLLGKYLQASMLIMVLIAIPISVLWWNIATVLVWLGQDPIVSEFAGQYLKYLIPALFASAVTQPFVKYFQAQSVVLPLMVTAVITLVFHVPIAYVLVFKVFGIGGFVGGAIAVDVAYWIMAMQLVLYAAWTAAHASEERKTWRGFTAEAFGLLLPFMRLAIPSTFMLCVQFWGFEVLTFLSGLLPNPVLELSFLSICLNTAGMLFTIPFGLSGAASTRLSNELGAGNSNAAKSATQIAVGISVFEILVVGTSLLLFGKLWARTFSDSPAVIEYTSSGMPYLALASCFDGIQGVLSGVARGCGRQDLCATMNIISVYGVGLPVALVLGFYAHLGAKGLYIGSICGLGCYTSSIAAVVLRTNWTKMSVEARSRVRESQEPLLLTT